MNKSILLAVTFYAASMLLTIKLRPSENISTIVILAAVIASVSIVIINPIKARK